MIQVANVTFLCIMKISRRLKDFTTLLPYDYYKATNICIQELAPQLQLQREKKKTREIIGVNGKIHFSTIM